MLTSIFLHGGFLHLLGNMLFLHIFGKPVRGEFPGEEYKHYFDWIDSSFAEAEALIDGEATPYGAQLAWPGVATFANLPATSAPIGRTPDGLPIGVQVIGPFLQDRTTIAIAGWLSALQAE